MSMYKIYHGLSGSFGGANCFEEKGYDMVRFDNEESASEYAYELACEDYDRFEGLYGLRTLDEIIEQDEVDEESAIEIYKEERENWLDYYVEEV